MERFLYRGVNVEKDLRDRGRLKPLAYQEAFKRKAVHGGGGSHYSDGTVYGESERNAIIQHQKDSAIFPTSGISTTPNYANAISYAKSKNKNKEGYVYKIDTTLLDYYGVYHKIVDEHVTIPTIPEDNEVILFANDGGCLPKEIIVEKIKID